MPERCMHILLTLVCVVLIGCGTGDVRDTGAVDVETATTQPNTTATQVDRVTAPATQSTSIPTATLQVLATPTWMPNATATVEAATPTAASPLEIADCASDDDVERFARAFVEAFNGDDIDRFAAFLPSEEQTFAGFEIGTFTAASRDEVLDVWSRRHTEREQWTVQEVAAGPRGIEIRQAGRMSRSFSCSSSAKRRM